nr:MAG TPA: Vps5 [Caudoviricetes sp.]
MKIYWSILTNRGYPTKEDKLREEEEYLRQLEKIRLMLGVEKESGSREEEFEVLVDSVKKLHETVSIKRADCEEQIENAKAKIEAAREEYERVTETGKKIIDCNMSIIEEFERAKRETLEELLGIFYKHNGDFTEKEFKELENLVMK